MTEVNLQHIVDHIKEYKRTHAVTHEELAEHYGVSWGMIQKLRKKEWGIAISTMLRMCNARGWTPNQFLGLEPLPEEKY